MSHKHDNSQAEDDDNPNGLLDIIDMAPPRVDISSITHYVDVPLKVVSLMDPYDFENFIAEWLFSKNYSKIGRIGSSGDMGRDVIATCPKRGLDYYQCKHTSTVFNDVGIEILKIIVYVGTGKIPCPSNYYFVCSRGMANKWINGIDKKELKNIWINWLDDSTSREVSDLKKSDLQLEQHIENFDFNSVDYIPIETVIDEHISGKYGQFRFGPKCAINRKTPEKSIRNDEETYVNQLLNVYSQKELKEINASNISDFELYSDDLYHQRVYYYSADSVREQIQNIFTDSNEFDILKEEVYEGVRETLLMDHENNWKRLLSTLSQASQISVQRSKLSSMYNLIGNQDKKGICHMLVNEGRIKWS